MQTVYVDVLLCVNLYVDYFILLSVRNFFALPTRKLRILAGASTGAAGSLIILLPHLPEIFSLLCNLLICTGMVSAAFLPMSFKKWMKLLVCTYFLSFGYAGAMLAIWYFLAPGRLLIRNGIVYFQLSPLLLAVLTAVFYLLFRLIGKITGKNENETLYCKVTVLQGEKSCSFSGKLDTGNTLREPFSGDPVMVVDENVLKELGELKEEQKRLVPYRTLSGKGVLWAFRPTSVRIFSGKKQIITDRCFVAGYPGKLENGCYEALVNPQLLWIGKEESL